MDDIPFISKYRKKLTKALKLVICGGSHIIPVEFI